MYCLYIMLMISSIYLLIFFLIIVFFLCIYRINSEQQAKFMYMYFNHMNLAEKTTMHADMKRNGHSLVPSDIMKLFADIYSDLSK